MISVADLQFPVDVAAVAKDHPFLDQDSLQSLFRRLHALNRTANMKVDNLQGQVGVGARMKDDSTLDSVWSDISRSKETRLQSAQSLRGRNPKGGRGGGPAATPAYSPLRYTPIMIFSPRIILKFFFPRVHLLLLYAMPELPLLSFPRLKGYQPACRLA